MKDEVPEIFKKGILTNETEADRLARKVREALSDLVDDYLVQAQQDFSVMQDLLSQAYKAPADKRFHLIRDDFFVKMHDLKGQGTTFGYPLLTEVGAFACDYLRNKKEIVIADLDLLKDLLSDMDLILKNKLTDSGGSKGKAIRDRIKKRKDA